MHVPTHSPQFANKTAVFFSFFSCLQERFQHAQQGLAVGSENRHARLHDPTVHAFEAAQAHAVHHGGRQPKGNDFRPREGQTLGERKKRIRRQLRNNLA